MLCARACWGRRPSVGFDDVERIARYLELLTLGRGLELIEGFAEGVEGDLTDERAYEGTLRLAQELAHVVLGHETAHTELGGGRSSNPLASEMTKGDVVVGHVRPGSSRLRG
jgi:hypothetical protein